MILVDTSLWIDHLRERSTRLADWLDAGLVVTHPFVIAELALGSIRNRRPFLAELDRLPSLKQARHTDVMQLISSRELASSGLGLVDVHLLTAALIHGVRLKTADRGLAERARRLGVG